MREPSGCSPALRHLDKDNNHLVYLFFWDDQTFIFFCYLAHMVKWGQTWNDHLQVLVSLIRPAGDPEPEAAVE